MKCLPVLFVIAALFASGEALLTCYECIGTKACNDPIDKSQVKQALYATGCDCMKVVLDYESSEKKTTWRGCLKPFVDTPWFKDDASRALYNGFKTATIDVCSTELCNGASSVIATQITFFAIVVIMIITYWQ